MFGLLQEKQNKTSRISRKTFKRDEHFSARQKKKALCTCVLLSTQCRGAKQSTLGMLLFNLPRRLHKPFASEIPTTVTAFCPTVCVCTHARRHALHLAQDVQNWLCFKCHSAKPRKSFFPCLFFGLVFFFHFFLFSVRFHQRPAKWHEIKRQWDAASTAD